MGNSESVEIVLGIPERCRAKAVDLYWQAFAAKLIKVMGPESLAKSFINRVLSPAHGIAALDAEGRLLGIAGFKTKEGALVGGSFADLRAVYGVFGATWRGVTISVLERPLAAEVLLMDGIVVTKEARGLGIGTLLLDAIKARALALGKSYVRLDVIDRNPRARALYERQGFKAGKTQSLGPLSVLFGFQHATTMTFTITPPSG